MRPLSPLLFWPIKFISVVSNFRKCLQIECAIRSVANVTYILIYLDSVQKKSSFPSFGNFALILNICTKIIHESMEIFGDCQKLCSSFILPILGLGNLDLLL